jgi:hypothetical protein
MPFFLVTPKLVRSSRAVAQNRASPFSCRTSLRRISAGTAVPCAVTEPGTTQSSPSRRAPWPEKVISGKARASSRLAEVTSACLFVWPEA